MKVFCLFMKSKGYRFWIGIEDVFMYVVFELLVVLDVCFCMVGIFKVDVNCWRCKSRNKNKIVFFFLIIIFDKWSWEYFDLWFVNCLNWRKRDIMKWYFGIILGIKSNWLCKIILKLRKIKVIFMIKER